MKKYYNAFTQYIFLEETYLLHWRKKNSLITIACKIFN